MIPACSNSTLMDSSQSTTPWNPTVGLILPWVIKSTIHGGSFKHKLNSKSSTERELISVSDGINQVLWTKHFLECQGYEVNSSITYHDIKASILLEHNGKRSSKKGTKHIKICYFFIKDTVQEGEIDIGYMPTGKMIADFFTKLL